MSSLNAHMNRMAAQARDEQEADDYYSEERAATCERCYMRRTVEVIYQWHPTETGRFKSYWEFITMLPETCEELNKLFGFAKCRGQLILDDDRRPDKPKR